jgi:hypothetical protein
MKSFVYLFIVLAFLSFYPGQVVGQTNSVYDGLAEYFKNPPSEAHPKVYWWCLNGNVDTVRAKQEFRAMKETGITGFDFFEIGVPKQDTMIPGGPAFMSDESVQNIKFVVDEAGKLGLTVGLNLASSWNAGGSWIEPRNGGKSLYVSKTTVNGNASEQKIKVPFPEISFPKEALIGESNEPMIAFREDGKPEYYEDVAILALPSSREKNLLDTADIIDVTPFFDAKADVLIWSAPPGNWEIFRYVCSNSGQQLVLPSPKSAGLTIDHFDSTAVETHLMYIINRLKPALGDFRKTSLKSFYLASYEARGFVWTSSLSSEFEKVNGYDITKFIPSFFNKELFSGEVNDQVQVDFKKTLSELMINNLYRKSREICNKYGLKINCEAGGPGYPLYNGPAEPLKAQGTLDIPRGEFWVNHSRFYKDGNDSIDILRVVKEVAAAAHIYQKDFIEEEAFTSFMHWQMGPGDIKPQGDRAFCEGMNRVVFHGFSHNISGSGHPGYVYHAGTHFNDKRVWWPKAKPFVEYLSRISAVAQNTNFVADVVWYYGDKIPNAATPKNTHFSAGPGFDYEVINTGILLHDLSVKNGKLTLSNGAEFSLLVLENEESINPNVLLRLKELVEQGVVVVGEKPKSVSAIKDSPITKNEGEKIINQLWTVFPENTGSAFKKEKKIYSEIKPVEMLAALNVSPDISCVDFNSGVIDFIHYSKNEIDFYFIRNTTDKWISRDLAFRQQNKVPEIWDAVSGEIVPVAIFKQSGEYVSLPVTLPPYGAFFVVFKESNSQSHFESVAGSGNNPPNLVFTKDGICFLQKGNIRLKKSGQTNNVNNEISTQALEGEWNVSFEKGWGAPDNVTFSKLMSWTDSEIDGIKYYSGTATYEKTFNSKIKQGIKGRIYLDLGEVAKVGEVWLNGKHLGITWAKPHRFDVTELLKSGKNVIRVEVANVWSNRIKGDAVTGQKFTNSNITNTIVPAPTIESGDQTRIPWANVPLIESGLIGPVKLIGIEPIGL